MGELGEIAFTVGSALAILVIVGFGLTRLLVPDRLRATEVLLVPMVGLAATIVAGSFAESTVLPLSQFSWILIGAAIVLDVIVLAKGRGTRRSVDLASVAPAVAIGTGVLILGVAPLVHYGFISTIGENWDPEIYLPLADVLARYVVWDQIPLAANPVLAMLQHPTVRLGWGFSWFHATVDVISGQPSYRTFAVLVALLDALQIPAVWVLGRLLGLRRTHLAIATGLLGVNALFLWTLYWGFAAQSVVYALLPGALAALIVAFDDGRPRNIVLASLLIAPLLLAYFGGAVPLLIGPVVLLLGRRLVLDRRTTDWKRLLVTAVAIGALSLLLSAIVQIRFVQAIPYLQGGQMAVGPDVTEFPPLGVEVGTLEYFNRQDYLVQMFGTPLGDYAYGAETLVAVVVLAIALFGAVTRWRSDLGMIGLGFSGLLFTLYAVIPYPYGYLKTYSLVAVVTCMCLVVGLEEITRWVRSWSRLAIAIPAGVGALIVAVFAFNGAQMLGRYLQNPPSLYPRQLLETADIRPLLKPGASVAIPDADLLQGPPMGFLGYVFDEQGMYGELQSGYNVDYNTTCPCNIVDYALVLADRPAPPEFAAYHEIWHGARFRLLERPQGLEYLMAWPDGARLPSGVVNSYALNVQNHAGSSTTAGGAFDVTARILTTVPTGLDVRSGSSNNHLDLPTGVSGTQVLKSVSLPGSIELSVDSPNEPVLLLSLEVWQSGRAPTTDSNQDDFVFAAWKTVDAGRAADIQFDFAASQGARPSNITVDIYGSSGKHYGWWAFNAPPDNQLGTAEMTLDLPSQRGQVTANGIGAGGSDTPDPAADDDYVASLMLWRNGSVWRTSPLFRFSLQNGAVTAFESLDGDFVAPVLSANSPGS